MAKKRFFGLVLSLFATLGMMAFRHTSKNNDSVISTHAESLVDVEKVDWDNQDWSDGIGKDWVKNKNKSLVPLDGYCLLPKYKSKKTLME